MGLTEAEARALLAGLICGVAMALALTAMLLIMLTRSASWTARAERAAGARLSAPILGIVFANALLVFWTLVGLLLGALYPVIDERRAGGGLLSENLAFTAFVSALFGGFAGAAWVIRGRVGTLGWITSGLAALIFGWALPLMAEPR